MLHFKLKVVDIKKETLDTVTLCFKQPALKKIKYLPGQYLTLIFHINSRKYIRPYSFSSAPGVDEHMEVTVKRVPGGIVSNHINDVVNVGDMVEAIQPMGDFVFNAQSDHKDKTVMLWGAGSGITPLISIAKYVLHKLDNQKVYLVYGNRNSESVIFQDNINDLKNHFTNTFKVWHFHTQLNISEANPDVIEGRISPAKVVHISRQQGDFKNTIHFICGPTGLKESVIGTLKKLDVNDSDVYSENFENIRSPEDLLDVKTQTVNIEKEGQVYNIEVAKGKSILEAALDASIDLDYSCQTGNCLLCKATVNSGRVKMIGAIKTNEKLMNDEYLLCCSHPLTDNVRIKFN